MNARPHLTEVTKIADDQSGVQKSRGLWDLAAELRERKVCRTAISYVLVMWLNLQIGDVIFPLLGLPDWSLNLVIVVGVMGFPVVLVVAWVFQVTPQGIVIDNEEATEGGTERRLDTLVNLLLLLSSIVLSFLLLLQFTAEQPNRLTGGPAAEAARDIVISELSFASTTDEAAVLAKGIHQELRHLLINLEGVEVLPRSLTPDPGDPRRRLALSGSLLQDGSTVHVLAHVIDLSAGRYLTSITFDLQLTSVLALELEVAERIVAEVNQFLQPMKPASLAKISREQA